MYQFDWADEQLWRGERICASRPSALPRERVAGTLLLQWQEHCIECAPPDCYAVCPLYAARADLKCARFVYGIYPNPAFSGLFDHGADIRFRRWGKLEAELGGVRSVSPAWHRRLDRADATLSGAVGSASRAFARLSPHRRLSGAFTLARQVVLERLPGASAGRCDEFVLECFAPDKEPFRLILELVRDGAGTTFRHAFDIRPGHNFHTLPAEQFGPIREPGGGRILVYPENDAERRVVFTWLDLVEYAKVPADVSPAEKVKCVAWDLDGTLWEGTLLEDGPEGRRARAGVLELVEALDERGILQTVVSKNDHDDAWRVVEQLGLQDHLLYPAINWGRKSENLRQVAKRLDIGLDTFAFVDDSAFERAEVEAALPMVRVYSHEQLGQLLGLPEFDVPVTELSVRRRATYLDRVRRERARERFGGDYLEFLRGSGLRLLIFEPREQRHVERCLELVQRSNQLNLSTRRYTRREFEELLELPGILSLALHCEDRFGDYGLVGFVAVDEREDEPCVRDFVLSCRVAQKRVEHAFFRWLAEHEAARGAELLRAELVRTSRNGPLARVFDELPFRPVRGDGERTLLELPLDERPADDGVVQLEVELAGAFP